MHSWDNEPERTRKWDESASSYKLVRSRVRHGIGAARPPQIQNHQPGPTVQSLTCPQVRVGQNTAQQCQLQQGGRHKWWWWVNLCFSRTHGRHLGFSLGVLLGARCIAILCCVTCVRGCCGIHTGWSAPAPCISWGITPSCLGTTHTSTPTCFRVNRCRTPTGVVRERRWQASVGTMNACSTAGLGFGRSSGCPTWILLGPNEVRPPPVVRASQGPIPTLLFGRGMTPASLDQARGIIPRVRCCTPATS